MPPGRGVPLKLAKAGILTNGTEEMTPIENTEDRYGAIAILFHWSMAFLIIGLAALGLYMVTLPDVGFNTKKITLVLYPSSSCFRSGK